MDITQAQSLVKSLGRRMEFPRLATKFDGRRERFVLHWEFIGWRLDVHNVGPISGLGLVYNAQERTKGFPKFAAM